MTHLVLRSGQAIGECDRGYRLRISDLNGYRRPLPVDALDFDNGGDVVRNALKTLPPRTLVGGPPRHCTECLKSAAVIKAIWSIKAYVACHIHGTVLVDHCGACQAPSRWARRSIDHCNCGEPMFAQSGQLATPHLVSASTAMVRLIDTGVPIALGKEQAFDALSAFCDFLWFFGLDEDHARWRAAFMAKPALPIAAPAVERGAATWRDWPGSFDSWLADRLSGSGAQTLAQWLTRLRKAFAEAVPSIVDEARRAIAEREDIPLLRSDALFASSSVWIPATKAANSLGATPACVARRIDSNAIAGRAIPRHTRTVRYIHSTVLAEAVDAQKGLISSTESAVILGISRRQISKFRTFGLLEPASTQGALTYRLTEVETLLRNVQAMAGAVAVKDPINLAFGAARCGQPLGLIVRHVLAGHLELICADSTRVGLAQFAVSARSVGQMADGGWSYAETAKRLKLSQRMIRPLVQAGCLELVPHNRPNRPRVASSSIEAFPAKYITTATVARELNTNTRGAIARLSQVGGVPIIEGCTRTGLSRVWDRAAVRRALGHQ